MGKELKFFFQRFRSASLLFLILGLTLIVGCGGDNNSQSGVFVDSPVAGLTYSSQHSTGTTDADGRFVYYKDETIIFSVGGLALGSAVGKSTITPLDVVSGATGVTDQRVTNILVFLQSLDEDGNLNNGIKINAATAAIVSTFANSINFNQTATAFQSDANVTALLGALNAANVFTDTDPRARTLRTAMAAQEHFNRSISDRKVVETQYGSVSGYAATATTWQFLGIPYAKPPIGDLRWRPPQEPDSWTGIREAVSWGDQAAQNPAYQTFGEGGMSEDCLYLNVTAPKDASNLPVMVWLHGGGFATLTGNTKAFNNAASLPTKGVVLVTVNHRLGAFGYMAHPLLTAESGYNGSGNYGQMDQVMALKWVKDNIVNFGGNPDNVTIFGESGGGGKVLFHMVSPQASGLFHKAVCQSGMYPPDTRSLAAAQTEGTALFTALGVTTLAQARAKSWTEIESTARTTVMAIPNVDGAYLPDTMRNIYETGKHNDVPFISGMNKNDINTPVAGIPVLIQYMPWLADKRTSNTYVYMFSQVPSGWASQGVGAYHGIELVYLFNYPGSFYSHYLLGLTGLTIDYTKTPAQVIAESGYGAADLATSDNMMTLWTNFAKTGIPGTENFTWPAYTSTNDTLAEIRSTLSVRTGLAAAFNP